MDAFRFSQVGIMMTLKVLVGEGQDEQDFDEDIKRHGGKRVGKDLKG